VKAAGRRALVGEEKFAATNWIVNDVLQQNPFQQANAWIPCILHLPTVSSDLRTRIESVGEGGRGGEEAEGEKKACSRPCALASTAMRERYLKRSRS